MNSLADGLPPEIAARINPLWRANEQAYWAVRESLRANYDGLWVAFADGSVIASGRRPVEVFHAGHQFGRHAFMTLVGAEETPTRMRRASFAYDTTYPVEPLPTMSVEFRASPGVPGLVFDGVIPDTGADASAMPWADCELLGLDPDLGEPHRVVGVGGSTVLTLSLPAWAWLDGQEYSLWLQAEFTSRERILGRDVLNRLDVLFRWPTGEVIINP